MKLNSTRMLLSAVLVAGCAGGGLATVPVAHWETVPAPDRQSIDAETQPELVAAVAEQKAATAGVLVAQHAVDAAVVNNKAPSPHAAPTPTSAADVAQATEDQHKAAARAGVEQARTASLRATLVWRQRRLDAAIAHVAMVVAEREFNRAYAIDHRMTQDQNYDVPRYRGQLAIAQERYYLADTRSTEAQRAMVHASSQVATAKEAFARLVRSDASALVTVARAPMQLSRFAASPDLRRHGLKVVAASPDACRRRTCFRHAASETSYLVMR